MGCNNFVLNPSEAFASLGVVLGDLEILLKMCLASLGVKQENLLRIFVYMLFFFDSQTGRRISQLA